MGVDEDVRVVIADDNAQIRSALSALFAQSRDIAVVAVVLTADEAVGACERLRPHVAVVDVGMPGGGLDAARRLAGSEVRVLLFTAHDEPAVRDEAAAAGVHGYVLKGDSGDLVQAVIDAAGT